MSKQCLIAAFLLVCGCSETPVSQVNDLAANYNSIKAYYYAEDGKVVRLGCDPTVVIINRANCNKRTDKLHRWGLEDLLRENFGIKTVDLETKITQIIIKLQNTDNQIDMLLDVEPGLQQDFVPEMDRIRDLIVVNATSISEYRDQIARILTALASVEDPDSRLLLIDLEAKLRVLQLERETLQKALADVRAKHFDANSSIINSTTIQRLFNQRKATVVQYHSAVSELEEDMRRTKGCYEILKFLDDSSTWEFTSYDTDYTARAASAIESVYRGYFHAISDHIQPVWNAEAQRFVITISGVNDRLSSITVRFQTGSGCQGMKIYGQGFSFELMGNKNLDRSTYDSVAAPIFEKPIDGKWFVEPICSGAFDVNNDHLYLYRVRN